MIDPHLNLLPVLLLVIATSTSLCIRQSWSNHNFYFCFKFLVFSIDGKATVQHFNSKLKLRCSSKLKHDSFLLLFYLNNKQYFELIWSQHKRTARGYTHLTQEADVCCSCLNLTAGGAAVQQIAQELHSKKVLTWILLNSGSSSQANPAAAWMKAACDPISVNL